MNHIKFSWVGSDSSEEGQATYHAGNEKLMTLVLPNFKTANAVFSALDLAYKFGKEDGIKRAKAAMLAGVDKL